MPYLVILILASVFGFAVELVIIFCMGPRALRELAWTPFLFAIAAPAYVMFQTALAGYNPITMLLADFGIRPSALEGSKATDDRRRK